MEPSLLLGETRWRPAPDDEFVEAVLELVDLVPEGRVTTYGALAEALGRGGPRRVGAVMAAYGDAVVWWRVVRADGSLPTHLTVEARQRHLAEGTQLRPSGKVDVAVAGWAEFGVPSAQRRQGDLGAQQQP